MRSGKLTRRIRLERATEAVNDLGTPVSTWAKLADLRAELVQESTAEFLGRGGATDVETVVFRTRYFDGVTTADRVSWRGTAYNIRQLAPIGRDEGWEIRCEAQNGGTP